MSSLLRRSLPSIGLVQPSSNAFAQDSAGQKDPPGTAPAITWCGATYRTTDKCDGLKKMATLPCSASLQTTAMATHLIGKDVNWAASTKHGGSFDMSKPVRSQFSLRSSTTSP